MLSLGRLVDIVSQQKQLRRMGAVVDNLEALYHEAQKTKGPKWCKEEPLWLSWSLEKFGSCFLLPAMWCSQTYSIITGDHHHTVS